MDNKYYVTDTELSWLFERFDKTKKGYISLEELTEEIMPKNSFK